MTELKIGLGDDLVEGCESQDRVSDIPEEFGDLDDPTGTLHGLGSQSMDSGRSITIPRLDVKRGQWVCEAAIWAVWENVGELISITEVVMLCVDATQLAKVLKEYEKAFVDTSLY